MVDILKCCYCLCCFCIFLLGVSYTVSQQTDRTRTCRKQGQFTAAWTPAVDGDSSLRDRVHSTSCESPALHLERSQILRACCCVCCVRVKTCACHKGSRDPHCLCRTIPVCTATSSGQFKLQPQLKMATVLVETDTSPRRQQTCTGSRFTDRSLLKNVLYIIYNINIIFNIIYFQNWNNKNISENSIFLSN